MLSHINLPWETTHSAEHGSGLSVIPGECQQRGVRASLCASGEWCSQGDSTSICWKQNIMVQRLMLNSVQSWSTDAG